MKLYSNKTDTNGTKRLSLLGIRIYKKWKSGNSIKRAYLGGIFKTKRAGYIAKYYFLGIKFYEKKDKFGMLQGIRNDINSASDRIIGSIQAAITVANTHSKIFPQFKNRHKGETAVLVGTAPSMLEYVPIKNAIHIGVNTAYQNPEVNLDYWFAIDYNSIINCIKDIQNTSFTKFFAQSIRPYPTNFHNVNSYIPNSIIDSCKNSYKFYFDQLNFKTINADIETQTLPDLGSCIFSAAYFALYTGVKKLYIVGCDSAPTGHFNGDFQVIHKCVINLPNKWRIFKGYADTFYPDTEIISINPVGLKGLFKDIYTNNNGEYTDEYGNVTDLNLNADNNKEYLLSI